ncbi:peptidoglycan recognition protein family protein [Phytomonospora endophytica]|uniref:N-acetyl-anhydromuramyl-L-alanine amidase AmpD n=1 Tax=Phytomonospora endophytica TaxID=714109 RepID=A0A841FWS2_9ACTN|nr:N-acetylmuramoyl-L-alanine amidase [Phytomonospora endophytica]MBB6037982.1 N-acetyl-anhydromuramyl-L-alanine amidase AmpD [Phytomonospora endophytica]GIG68881.1 N-acetylmuramoyl-L-alanine amidase [Phytomonospora endophytica]
MATITWLADVLRQAGVPVVEEGDWRNRMRPGAFDPIGVLWHHTASTSSAGNPAPALNICINGRPDLPGPLCQALVDYNGVFHIISAGRANHAGASRGSGPIPAGDGNALLVGWEIDYNGVSQEMTDAQYRNSVKATVAVLRRLGKGSAYVRGHRETSTSGKIDPSFIDLDLLRAEIAALLGEAPSWPILRKGATGENVRTLQFLLRQHGATLTVDGDFGAVTETAVRAFQTAGGLTVDGVVGAQSWPKLVVTLRQGATGEAVKALQRRLAVVHGFNLNVDGNFATATNTAVRSFQTGHGLTVDGVVGPVTWLALIG